MHDEEWDSDEVLDVRAWEEHEHGQVHGLQSLYERTPAEAVMEAEEAQLGLGAEDRTGGVSALFGGLLSWHLEPVALGWRAYAMLHALEPWWWPQGCSKSDRRMIERTRTPIVAVGAEVAAKMLRYHAERVGGCDAEKLGKRLHVFCFLFVRDVDGRGVLRSLETIGELWGLKAKNKRSAPHAAVERMREEIARMYVRTGGRAEDIVVPGGKGEETRLRCQAAQMGNTNRLGGGER